MWIFVTNLSSMVMQWSLDGPWSLDLEAGSSVPSISDIPRFWNPQLRSLKTLGPPSWALETPSWAPERSSWALD